MQVTTGISPNIDWKRLTELNVARTQRLMEGEGIDAVLVATIDNWRYLTGLPLYYCLQWFVSNFAILTRGTAFPLLMPLEGPVGQMKALAPWFVDFVPLPRAGASDAVSPAVPGPWIETIAGALRTLRQASGTIALDPGLPFYLKDGLVKALPHATFVSAGDLLRKARLIKNEEEIKAIRAACAIDEVAMDRALRAVEEGRTEVEIAGVVDYVFRSYGAESSTANPFVGAGDHPFLGYLTPSNKVIRHGELVRVDIGCAYGGYYSDFSRSVAVGRPDRETERVYEIVKEGLCRASAAIRPGVMNYDLFTVCDQTMREMSSGRYGIDWWFLGHGLGVGIHEDPMIGKRGSVEEFALEEGMYFCLEPCITIPGKGMIGLEDDMVVTKDGVEILTRTEFSLTMAKVWRTK
jgi:Xaa-Pro aminopeptidase